MLVRDSGIFLGTSRRSWRFRDRGLKGRQRSVGKCDTGRLPQSRLALDSHGCWGTGRKGRFRRRAGPGV